MEVNAGTDEEHMNNAEDSIDDTEGDMSEDYRMTVEQLKESNNERCERRRTCYGIMFKKVDNKVLKVETDRVNKAIKYLKSKSITDTNVTI